MEIKKKQVQPHSRTLIYLAATVGFIMLAAQGELIWMIALLLCTVLFVREDLRQED